MSDAKNTPTTQSTDYSNLELELPDAALILACDRYCTEEAAFRAFSPEGATPIVDDAARILAQAPHRLAQATLMVSIAELRSTTLEGAQARARAAIAWHGPEGEDEPGYDGEVAEIISYMVRDLLAEAPHATA